MTCERCNDQEFYVDKNLIIHQCDCKNKKYDHGLTKEVFLTDLEVSDFVNDSDYKNDILKIRYPLSFLRFSYKDDGGYIIFNIDGKRKSFLDRLKICVKYLFGKYDLESYKIEKSNLEILYNIVRKQYVVYLNNIKDDK
jgi:hypothetical protein